MASTSRPPKWIKPQLTRLIDEAPTGGGWLHEIKYDGYAHARRADRPCGQVKLLTCTGLDWSHRYKRTTEALGSLKVKSAYLDGELCALYGDGVPCSAGSRLRSTKAGQMSWSISPSISCFWMGGTSQRPLIERKAALQRLLTNESRRPQLQRSRYGDGPRFHRGLRAAPGGRHLKASQSTLRARRPRDLGEDEVPQPRGVRGCRLDRSGGQPRTSARCFSATTRTMVDCSTRGAPAPA